MTVEGSQGDLAAMKLELAERGVDDLPRQLEGIGGGNLGQQVDQRRNGASRGKHGNVLLALGKVEQTIEPALYPFDKTRPGFQPGRVVSAADPAFDNQFKDALEFCRVMGGIVHRRQGLGLVWQQAGKQGVEYGESIEFVEGSVCFNGRGRQPGGAQLRQGMARGVLLARQVARQATVQAQAQMGQVLAGNFGLAHAQRRQPVVVVGTEGGLAMSDQINAAHVRVIPLR